MSIQDCTVCLGCVLCICCAHYCVLMSACLLSKSATWQVSCRDKFWISVFTIPVFVGGDVIIITSASSLWAIALLSWPPLEPSSVQVSLAFLHLILHFVKHLYIVTSRNINTDLYGKQKANKHNRQTDRWTNKQNTLKNKQIYRKGPKGKLKHCSSFTSHFCFCHAMYRSKD